MRVRLNLATTPLENHRRFLLSATLVGTVALGLLFSLALRSYRDWRQSAENRIKIAQLQGEMRALRNDRRELEEFFKRVETRKAMDRAAFLNELIEQRSFPWTRIFMDLERLLPQGVRVVSISPRMRLGRVEVRLVVGASSDEGKLRFLKTLEAAREFIGVQVLSENRPNRRGESDRVLLELVAWYASVEP